MIVLLTLQASEQLQRHHISAWTASSVLEQPECRLRPTSTRWCESHTFYKVREPEKLRL